MRFFSYYLVAAVAVLGGFFLGMRYQMLSDNVEEVRYLVRLHENRIQRLNEENAQLKETVDKLGTVVKLRKLLQDRRIRMTRGSVEDLAESIHPHPTLSETLMESAEMFFDHATHAAPRRKRAKG